MGKQLEHDDYVRVIGQVVLDYYMQIQDARKQVEAMQRFITSMKTEPKPEGS